MRRFGPLTLISVDISDSVTYVLLILKDMARKRESSARTAAAQNANHGFDNSECVQVTFISAWQLRLHPRQKERQKRGTWRHQHGTTTYHHLHRMRFVTAERTCTAQGGTASTCRALMAAAQTLASTDTEPTNTWHWHQSAR